MKGLHLLFIKTPSLFVFSPCKPKTKKGVLFFYRHKVKANIKLTRLFVDSGIERYYAVFLKLKSVHTNGRYYNYSPYKMAQQSGLSRNAIQKYMKFFIENKWVRVTGNDIVFISSWKLKKLYDIKLKADYPVNNGSISEIVKSLRYEILKAKERQFKYANQLRKDQCNPTGKGALKRHKKAVKSKLYFFGEFSEHLKISQKKLANLINKSRTTVGRLIKDMGATVIPGKKSYYKCNNVDLPYGFYYNNGYVVKIECNSYIF